MTHEESAHTEISEEVESRVKVLGTLFNDLDFSWATILFLNNLSSNNLLPPDYKLA